VEGSPGANGGRDVLRAARRKVVHPGDLVAVLNQAVDEMRSDEPGRAGDEYPHRVMIASTKGRWIHSPLTGGDER
jgi:hypothetical protein